MFDFIEQVVKRVIDLLRYIFESGGIKLYDLGLAIVLFLAALSWLSVWTANSAK